MGTPYFILGTGQSNMFGYNNYNWSPNSRVRQWNNDIGRDMSIGSAYAALPTNEITTAGRYAHNIAVADPNKDVYLARYARGGRGISFWFGGAFFKVDYTAFGAGRIYLNNPNPAAVTAIWLSLTDNLGVAREGMYDTQVGEMIFVSYGSTVYQYRVESLTFDSTPNTTFYVSYVSGSGSIPAGADVQVDVQPRLLRTIENSVPAALAACGKSTIDMLLWWQGESDITNPRYEIEFNFVMNYMANKSWWSPQTKIIICGINSTENNGIPQATPMNNRLAALVNGYTNREFCHTAVSIPASDWLDVWHLKAVGMIDTANILFNNVYAPPLVGPGTVTYTITPSTTSVAEGGSVTFTVNTTNVGNATLYWSNSGTTSGADFTDGLMVGSVSIVNNQGSFTRQIATDSLAEGNETIVMQLRTGSTAGTIVATSSTVTVTNSGGTGSGTIVSITAGNSTAVLDVSNHPSRRNVYGPSPMVGSYGLFLDAPPYPYRDGSGTTYINLTHSENYRGRIPSWSNPAGWVVEGPTLLSARDTIEGHYNNRQWMNGIYASGNNVYVLSHMEWYVDSFTAEGIPGFNVYGVWAGTPPPAGLFNTKWVNAIGHFTSTNGGASYNITTSSLDSRRCVLIPEPWAVQSQLWAYGFFHPSNIVKEGNYYYACIDQRSVVPEAPGKNKCGVSMIRTSDITKSTGWEFWNGSSWETVNHNYYQGNISTQKPYMFFEAYENGYVTPLPNSHMGQSLRFHTPSNLWIMFGFSADKGPFAYSTSPTLANPQWGGPYHITVPAGSQENYVSAAGRYIAVFDENATDQNFRDIGNNITVMVARVDTSKIYKASLTIVSTSAPDPNPTYKVVPSVTTVNEGGVVTFTITTTNFSGLIYWRNIGTTNYLDFANQVIQGSVNVVGNTATISMTLVNDLQTEGTESIIVELRYGSSSGPIVATSSTVLVYDTSGPSAPTFVVYPDKFSVNEGQSVTFTVETADFGTGTLYWTNSGTTTAVDFVNNVNAGTVSVVNDNGSFTMNIVNDLTTEGTETIIAQLRTGSLTGPIVATASVVSVSDTSVTPPVVTSKLYFRNNANSANINASTVNGLWIRNQANTGWINKKGLSGLRCRNANNNGWISFDNTPAPTYSLSPSTSSIAEGGSVYFSVTTTNFGSGTLYWTNSGTTNAADFADGVNSGSLTITNNGGTLTRALVADAASEGNETIIIELRTGSISGPVVATASTVTVTEGTPTPTYSIGASASGVNEGATVTFPITTTNVGNATLYWTNGGTTNAADFTDNINSGSVTITNNAGARTFNVKADGLVEGGETIVFQLRTGSTSGTIVASTSVTVNDTSVPSVPTQLTMNRNNYDHYFLPDSIGTTEGYQDIRILVTTTDFFNRATNDFDHIFIATDCGGAAGNYDPHCGPIIRNGQNLFTTARGFFIARSGQVSWEVWNGTSSTPGGPLTNTISGTTFNPVSGTYFIRARFGYSTGPYANMATIEIFKDSRYGAPLFMGSVASHVAWNGYYRTCFGAIATGFRGVDPSVGCVEPTGPGSAYGGYIPFQNFERVIF